MQCMIIMIQAKRLLAISFIIKNAVMNTCLMEARLGVHIKYLQQFLCAFIYDDVIDLTSQ